MATLVGSTVQNWSARLVYYIDIVNNKMTITTNNLNIWTNNDYTVTNGAWRSNRATFQVRVINTSNNNEVLATWNITNQTWTISKNKSQNVDFKHNITIDADLNNNKVIKLELTVTYNYQSSTGYITETLPKIPSSTITFNQGDSNVSVPTNSITTIDTWTVPAQEMTKSSYSVTNTQTVVEYFYEFRGWSTVQNVTNGNAEYKPSMTYYRPGTDITIYPAYFQYTKTYHSAIITFNQNLSGVVVSSMPSSLRNNTATGMGRKINFTIPNVTPTTSNKLFIGWRDNNGYEYQPGDTIEGISGQIITLYAQWISNSATLYFNLNHSTATANGVPVSTSINYNSAYTIPISTPLRTGYGFLGWAKFPNGDVVWEPGDNFKTANSYKNSLNENIFPNGYTLYAVWEESYILIEYSENGTEEEPAELGTVPESELAYFSKTYRIPMSIPVRPGYDFVAWSTTQDDTGTRYYENDIFKQSNTLGTDESLYAIWQPVNSTSAEIIYNANGGSLAGITSPQTITYANAANITSTPPTKTGYTFNGWVDVSGTQYNLGAQYKTANSTPYRIVLIADWILNGNIYVGINGKAKKIKNIYIGDEDGVAKQVTAVYVGVDGKAKKVVM